MMPYGLKRKRNYLYTDSPENDWRKMKRRERQQSKRDIEIEIEQSKEVDGE